ncbi:hypothetical protein ACIQ9P_07220 [Kitasatospora sp. NPDC094019]|uniref:hypothetical protein n=1 Tax=Kitasatospora sp. NPDC094019 TaxID=3364091 RepID=UPI003800435A
MRRTVSPRVIALTVAGLVAGSVAALSLPALATSPAKHRAAPVQALVLDFSGGGLPDSFPDSFGGSAKLKDTDDKVIGEAQVSCAKQRSDAAVAVCSGFVDIADGDTKGMISFTTRRPLSADAVPPASDEGAFTGVVTGGARAYEGVTGEARIKLNSPNVHALNFSWSPKHRTGPWGAGPSRSGPPRACCCTVGPSALRPTTVPRAPR